ncbi:MULTISPECIES: hypothetical protein [unclassified Curtobacterium]|jgi:hypothetical protein|uniref:hypothetical protein n=1 Tax=unclassified Curtobacterium TaxID=257496 RepID=UPI000F4A2360|nr:MULTISPECIES: hypothetical protein [unclassified Curtobacterium]ROQ04937.1 hypothetical protein EDF41_3056 [Curtobacterium sp. PhB171]ROQ22138.1 hypothetical protein EDF40_3224 [Curtobacterium sp. PhB170]ROS33498.1 hypothetical protein EDF25_2879 [Curtobacterium sp. PhB131]ROS64817.1 hypothetical protein EDF30_3231 [Curtobacterium sp. PhB141]
MTDEANESRSVVLRLVSLTLAFDDVRFFGAAIFSDANDPDGLWATVLVDHAGEEPWFRLTTTDPSGSDVSDAAMAETDRLMRFILTHHPERIGRTRPTSPAS